MNPKTWLLIIDADPIVYRVGFAGESSHYHIIAEDCDGHMLQRLFSPGDDETAFAKLKAWRAANPKWEVVDQSKHVEVEPLANVLHMARMQIDSIIREVKEAHKIDQRDLYVHLILSGGDNYRNEVATLKGYKANRDPAHKPAHYKEIREYLMRQYGAHMTDGIEADDHACIRAHDALRVGYSSFVVATIDKDLDQIPGMHYNYMHKVHYEVSEDEARLWFWRQLLSGDATDNIGGACFIGPLRADQYMEKFTALSEEERWAETIRIYRKQGTRSRCYYRGKDPREVALENAQLIYLQRKPGELWMPPGETMGQLEAKLDD